MRNATAGMSFTGNQNGIALLLVLGCIAVLMMAGFSFARAVRTDLFAAMNFDQAVNNRLLAEAGIERAMAELVYRAAHKGRPLPAGYEAVRTDGTVYSGSLGKGFYRYRITDESGKLSLNALSDRSGIILSNFLIKNGISPEQAETVVDSILDWKDADELHRLKGAESDYYRSLPRPYQARNADFETLEELLYVKGITADMLFGKNGAAGLIHVLSVHAPQAKINILSAPRELLEAIPGISGEMADLILEMRKSEDPPHVDLRVLLGEGYAAASADVTVSESDTYTIEAAGYQESEKKKYTISATVRMQGDGGFIYLYYKSPSLPAPSGQEISSF